MKFLHHAVQNVNMMKISMIENCYDQPNARITDIFPISRVAVEVQFRRYLALLDQSPLGVIMPKQRINYCALIMLQCILYLDLRIWKLQTKSNHQFFGLKLNLFYIIYTVYIVTYITIQYKLYYTIIEIVPQKTHARIVHS